VYEMNFKIHGLKVKFSTPDKIIANFIKENLGYFLWPNSFEEDCQISFYRFPFTKKKEIYSTWLSKGEQLAAVGVNLYFKNGESIISHFNNLDGLSVRLGLNKENPFIEGVYCSGKKEFLRNSLFPQRVYSAKLLNSIKRLVVHYPLLYLLEQKKKIYFLHASAVEKEGKGFIFTGLPGCGKTTVMTILLKEGFHFLSDNFLLWNKDRLFAFPELLRIRDGSIFREDMFMPSSLRNYYRINPAFVTSEARPQKIFLLRLGEQSYLKKIQPQNSLRAILNLESTMKEFRDYSYLKLDQFNNKHAPSASSRTKHLEDLLERMQVFILSLRKGEKNNKEFLFKVLGE